MQYVIIAYELKSECNKNITCFENLLTSWELDTLKQLKTAVYSLVNSVGISETDITSYDCELFCTYFFEKKKSAPQNEKINTFIYGVEKRIEKYSEQIKICAQEFKNYF